MFQRAIKGKNNITFLQKASCVLILVLIVQCATAQVKNVGIPFIKNYNREVYKGGTQNWSISQDSKGRMFFANNKGVLIFNGSKWELLALPNKSIVRSVKCIGNRFYVGGYNAFGFFSQNKKGEYSYTSLTHQLNNKYKMFDEVWRILESDQGIVFQSYYYLFLLGDQGIKVFEPKSNFGFSYQIGGRILIVDQAYGLYHFNGNEFMPLLLDDAFFEKNEINFIFEKNDENLLIGTRDNGIYELKSGVLQLWDAPINKQFAKSQIYTGMQLNKQQFAVGTIQNGLYLVNTNGAVDLHLNRNQALQHNTILSMFFDRNKNLWLGLDNGISMLETNSPFTMFNYSYNIESSYTSIIHNHILYIGTNQGLFYSSLSGIKNSSLQDHKFKKVEGVLGQVWSLEIINQTLFCGHSTGAFVVNNGKGVRVSDTPGVWTFKALPWDENYIISGHYSGLSILKKKPVGNGWEDLGVLDGFSQSSKEILFDQDKNLWISHALMGLFKVDLNAHSFKIDAVINYSEQKGLPHMPYRVLTLDNRMVVLANNILYSYNDRLDTFYVNNNYEFLLNHDAQLTSFQQNEFGDIWYFGSNKMGVMRLQEDGSYNHIQKPFCRIGDSFIKNSFENVYSVKNQYALIGSQDGMIHYSHENNKEYETEYNSYIEKITTTNNQGNIVYKLELEGKHNVVPYSMNTISFEFYTPFFEKSEKVEHAYRLLGLNNKWSDWDRLSVQNFNNLREGEYVFEVKAKNIYNNESNKACYAFTIKAPYYRSNAAYAIYFIVIVALIILNLLFFKNRIEKAKADEKAKRKKKEQELKLEVEVSEKKIVQLEEDKLKGEMRLKNIELANSTMNLIQKNKLLTNVKRELSKVLAKAKSNEVKTEVSGLIRKIDRDINNDKNFKVFDEYFDRVHQDFLKRLKEQHPNLTPKDLRLCAYLRMNISTKEIAPLMNVSIRGLEISRYRLRKKIGIARETNLVEYIMGI